MAGKILVLDDEENYARMVSDLLEGEGFRTEVSIRPKEALETLRDDPYDLVVADFKMPGMDGSQFLAEARKINPALPVIMVSGLMNTPDLLKVANLGVNLALEKPFDTEQFLEAVRRYAEPAGAAEEPAAPQSRAGASDGASAYPANLQFLAGACHASRQFIQELWDAAQQKNHIFIVAPYGSEFEIVVKEISAWKGYGEKRSYNLSVHQMEPESTPEMLAQIMDDPSVSKTVVISGLEDLTRDEQAIWAESLLSGYGQLPNRQELLLLYCCYDEKFPSTDEETELSPLKILLDESAVIRLPPLRERLPDLALYAQHNLSHFAAKGRHADGLALAPDAARFLLHYPWPGNYQELVDTLRRAIRRHKTAVMEEADLKRNMPRIRRKPDLPATPVDLKGYLLTEQYQYLRRILQKTGGNMDAAEKEAKANLDNFTLDKPPEEQTLIYPDLTAKV